MKFALNGALTIGTLDGANIEIRQEVGEENFFLFGLTAEEVRQKRLPDIIRGITTILIRICGRAIDLIQFRSASPAATPTCLSHWYRLAYQYDPYMLFADYQSYIECQEQVSEAYKDQRSVDADVYSQYSPNGQIFLRPCDSGVLRENLEREASQGSNLKGIFRVTRLERKHRSSPA